MTELNWTGHVDYISSDVRRYGAKWGDLKVFLEETFLEPLESLRRGRCSWRLIYKDCNLELRAGTILDAQAEAALILQIQDLEKDRQDLLEALLPLALGLACQKSSGFDPARGTLNRCGECPICVAYKLSVPVVKWIRKGYKSSV